MQSNTLFSEWKYGDPITEEPTDGFIEELFKQSLTGLHPRDSPKGGHRLYIASEELKFIVTRNYECVDFSSFLKDGKASKFAFVGVDPNDGPDIPVIGRVLDAESDETTSRLANEFIHHGERYGPIFPHLEFSHLAGNRQLLADDF